MNQNMRGGNLLQFYETKAGRIFFESQLPKLISVLTDISAALKNRGTAYIVKPEISEDFLADLYHGNYDPSGRPYTQKEAELTPEIVACQQQLREAVSADTWELIERYNDLMSSRRVLEREQAFASGFRSAMTMLAAGLSQPLAVDEG